MHRGEEGQVPSSTVCNSAYDMEDNMSEIIDCKPDYRSIAILLRAHLRCMAAGMKHSRISGKELLAKATLLTGKPYNRGGYEAAIADLNTLINAPT